MAADLWFKKQMQEELQSGVEDQEHSEHPREELGTRARELRMQSRLTARELCSGRKDTYPVKGGHEDFRLSRPCCFYCNSSVLGASQGQHAGNQGCIPITFYEC